MRVLCIVWYESVLCVLLGLPVGRCVLMFDLGNVFFSVWMGGIWGGWCFVCSVQWCSWCVSVFVVDGCSGISGVDVFLFCATPI